MCGEYFGADLPEFQRSENVMQSQCNTADSAIDHRTVCDASITWTEMFSSHVLHK